MMTKQGVSPFMHQVKLFLKKKTISVLKFVCFLLTETKKAPLIKAVVSSFVLVLSENIN